MGIYHSLGGHEQTHRSHLSLTSPLLTACLPHCYYSPLREIIVSFPSSSTQIESARSPHPQTSHSVQYRGCLPSIVTSSRSLQALIGAFFSCSYALFRRFLGCALRHTPLVRALACTLPGYTAPDQASPATLPPTVATSLRNKSFFTSVLLASCCSCLGGAARRLEPLFEKTPDYADD